ncbi:MAG TPA: family 20 glycosylhydrolase [Melioribacteraceae bacterium]|nr:family 20 glycosylhydrolase [Melioribacteraceae bacterium]
MVKEKLIRLFTALVIMSVLSPIAKAQEKVLSIIPLPKEYRIFDGYFELSAGTIVRNFMDENESLNIVLNDIDSVFSHLYNKKFIGRNSGSELLIGIPSKNRNFKKLCETLKLIPGKEIGNEGYLLLIEKNRIFISANSVKGVFYGLQSLKQLIKGSVGTGTIPNVYIKDYPSFEFRGVMDDISRGPIPTLDFVKYQIRRLAELKVNLFSHYVEHVVKTKKHPAIAPDDGSYTIEEWKEISDYAKKYFITVMGSFQSFGHFQSILSNPDYAHLGESGTLISPVKEESYQFLKDIYDEMIPAFDAPFFNINCDETFDLGKAESKRLVDSIGYDGAYIQHVTRLNKYVKANGVRALIWGDIILDYPGIIPRLPEDMIVGTWNYDDNENFERFLKPFRGAGRDFMISPGVLNSNKIFPDFHKAFNNIKKFISEGKEAGAFGVLVCVWDDGGTALFNNDWLGVAYGAEKCWNHNSDDRDFDSRFNRAIYAGSNNSLTSSIWKLNELIPLESTDGMNDKILFSKLVPDSGRSTKISLVDWDEVSGIISDAEKELINSQFVFHMEERNFIQFIIDLYRVLVNERMILIQSAESYKEALNIQNKNRSAARNLILQSLNNIERLIRQINGVKADFEILWLQENHTYALDRISSRYQKKVDDYNDIKSRLKAALKNIDSSLPLPSAESTRLSITKLPGKYFREWLMVNPIINKDNSKISAVDYLIEMGGELNAEPKVAEEFFFDSAKYRWRRVVTDYPDTVKLAEIFPDNNQNSVLYAFANIFSEEDQSVNALVSGDDEVEVIINGSSVFKGAEDPAIPGKEDPFMLPLKKGKNNLMLKISQTSGDWRFTFRLPESSVRNSKNRYRIVTDN